MSAIEPMDLVRGVLTVAIMRDLVYQRFNLHRQLILVIKLLLRFSNILADLGPKLQFLIIAKAVVSGSGAVARHPPFTNQAG